MLVYMLHVTMLKGLLVKEVVATISYGGLTLRVYKGKVLR